METDAINPVNNQRLMQRQLVPDGSIDRWNAKIGWMDRSIAEIGSIDQSIANIGSIDRRDRIN
jgi:hypothetical protein